MPTMLKFQNIDVLEFDFDTNQYEILNKEFLPFLLRDRNSQRLSGKDAGSWG